MTRRTGDYTSEKDKQFLFDQQNGQCYSCPTKLRWDRPRNWITEHENQLSISKDNSLKNKTLRCKDCASVKTYGTKATSYGSDAHARAKIDRILGITGNGPKRKIQQPANFKWPKRKLESRNSFQKRIKT